MGLQVDNKSTAERKTLSSHSLNYYDCVSLTRKQQEDRWRLSGQKTPHDCLRNHSVKISLKVSFSCRMLILIATKGLIVKHLPHLEDSGANCVLDHNSSLRDPASQRNSLVATTK